MNRLLFCLNLVSAFIFFNNHPKSSFQDTFVTVYSFNFTFLNQNYFSYKETNTDQLKHWKKVNVKKKHLIHVPNMKHFFLKNCSSLKKSFLNYPFMMRRHGKAMTTIPRNFKSLNFFRLPIKVDQVFLRHYTIEDKFKNQNFLYNKLSILLY